MSSVKTANTKVLKPEIGISRKHLEKSIDLLSGLLSNEMILYIKTRKFHWNVSGESFMELHKLFQSQYAILEEIIDLVAERINKLGGKTIGAMKEFCELTQLKENAGEYPDQKEMLIELLADHERVTLELRNEIEAFTGKNADVGTVDFLTGLLEQHETIAWVLRRYLS